jgi:hypothetical protein
VLAPVLARLDAIPGVTSARVDSSGRFFWLALEEGADARRLAELAKRVLGAGARSLPADEAQAQLAAHGRGDPWLLPGEVMALSFVESRLLSVRIAGEVERRTGATPDEREAIAEAIRRELFAVMDRVHAEGGRESGGWIHEEWPAIAAAAAARCAGAVAPELRRQVSEILPTLLGR